jgi:hypothetical protein
MAARKPKKARMTPGRDTVPRPGPLVLNGGRFRVRTFAETGDLLIAAADAELVGRVFREPERGLRLEVSESFYGTVEVGEETLRHRLSSGTILNLVGERTIGVAREMGLVGDRGVIEIGGVPHAQVVFIPDRPAAVYGSSHE